MLNQDSVLSLNATLRQGDSRMGNLSMPSHNPMLTSVRSMDSSDGMTSMNNHQDKTKYPKERLEYTIMDPSTYKFRMDFCQIRPDKNMGPRKERVKTPWSIELGLFKEYVKEEK